MHGEAGAAVVHGEASTAVVHGEGGTAVVHGEGGGVAVLVVRVVVHGVVVGCKQQSSADGVPMRLYACGR